MLPILCLRGLSTGDFQEALPVLLGEEAAGLPPANISRVLGVWEEEIHNPPRPDPALIPPPPDQLHSSAQSQQLLVYKNRPSSTAPAPAIR